MWGLGAALAATVIARFVRLDIDPPYGIVTHSAECLTDEGWYTKSAQLHAKFGQWVSEHDVVWFSHNALFTLVQTIAFELFGISVYVARTVSVVAFCVTLAAFYAILRTVHSRPVALATCLIPAVTLQTFAYSRVALVEPTGVAVSMLALLAWTRLPRGVVACTVGLLFASAAYFVKASFIFTIAALVVLCLGEAVVLARGRRWGHALLVLAAVVAVPLAARGVQRSIIAIEPAQASTFVEWHVQGRIEQLLSRGNTLLTNEAKAVYRVAIESRATALFATFALGALVLLVRRRRRPAIRWSRGEVAVLLWGVGGVAFFGLFKEHTVRYFYFAIFPLAVGAVMVLRELVPNRFRAATIGLLLVHAAIQVPATVAWLGRDNLTSHHAAARDAVARMDLDGGSGEVAVVGGTASYLGFYHPRIRPLDYRWEDCWLDLRVGRWRPRYLFVAESAAHHLVEVCPKTVARVEPMASYRIMDNFFTDENLGLYRIVYTE